MCWALLWCRFFGWGGLNFRAAGSRRCRAIFASGGHGRLGPAFAGLCGRFLCSFDVCVPDHLVGIVVEQLPKLLQICTCRKWRWFGCGNWKEVGDVVFICVVRTRVAVNFLQFGHAFALEPDALPAPMPDLFHRPVVRWPAKLLRDTGNRAVAAAARCPMLGLLRPQLPFVGAPYCLPHVKNEDKNNYASYEGEYLDGRWQRKRWSAGHVDDQVPSSVTRVDR